jgi:DNA-binding transcriptional LysR family regulator
LTIERLAEHSLICMPAGTGIRTVLDRSLAAAAVKPGAVLEATAPDAIADLSARGMGVGVLATSMADSYRDRLAAIAITNISTPALLAVVWSERANPALRELVERVTTAFGDRVAPDDVLSASPSEP